MIDNTKRVFDVRRFFIIMFRLPEYTSACLLIRPHRSITWMRPIVIDGVVWYVCLSVGLSVCHSREPCKTRLYRSDAVWDIDWGGPNDACIVHVRRRCSLMSNYFNHLFLLRCETKISRFCSESTRHKVVLKQVESDPVESFTLVLDPVKQICPTSNSAHHNPIRLI